MRRGAIRRRRSIIARAAVRTGISISPMTRSRGSRKTNKLGDDRVLTVRTGLDTGLQLKTESVIEDMLRVKAPAFNAHQAATVIAETNGLVRAMVGGRDYGASQFNRATDALRQPGSSFKIFVYLTALLTGKYHGNTPDRRFRRLHRRLLRA